MDSYFYVFKFHFGWEDCEKKIISCDIRSNDQYIATVTLNLNSNVICLIKGNLDTQMPENDFRDFILKATRRWVEKKSNQ